MAGSVFIQWRTEYSVGIQEIDDQHKEIMELINRLLEICREDDAAGKHESFNKLLLMIIDHFYRHFKTEEQLMLEKKYPYYEEHKKRHDKMLEDAEKMAERITREGQKVKLINMVIFLREWFIENIYGIDKKMGEFLAASNNSAASLTALDT